MGALEPLYVFFFFFFPKSKSVFRIINVIHFFHDRDLMLNVLRTLSFSSLLLIDVPF